VKAQQNAPITILFVHYGDDWIRGSEGCLLNLMRHLAPLRYRAVLWCNSPVLAAAAQALNVDVECEAFPLLFGWQRPRWDLCGYFRLVRRGKQLVQRHSIDLIHANSGAPMQWLNWVARACHRPLVTHLHARYPLRDRITLGLHHSAMVVGVSKPVVEQLRQDGMPAERTRVIANGIDVDALETAPAINVRQHLQLRDDDYVIATAGSLILRKGIDVIMHALQRLVRQGVPAHLLVIGDGEERQTLQRLMAQLELQRHVHFVGEQPQVTAWLRGGVDVFASGAREEVFGLVLAEAGLSNLAVVAPRVGGIASVVKDGHTGILIPSEDPEAMATALMRLYQQPKLRSQLGQAGRQRVLQCFTIERHVAQFDQLYQQLLQHSQHRMRWWRHWSMSAPITGLLKTLTTQWQRRQQRRQQRKQQRHLLVFDPTAFAGGSKVATTTALSLINPNIRVTVLTADATSWQGWSQLRLYQPRWLATQDHGLKFFVRHCYLALWLLIARLRKGRIDMAVGASGPGVDLALYIARPWLRFQLLQCVHGPVAASRTLGRCLWQADRVHFLTSSQSAVMTALNRVQPTVELPSHFTELSNGLSKEMWPSPTHYDQVELLWAASLLRWKGLDTLLQALQRLEQPPVSHICYIRPRQTSLPISQAPIAIDRVHWYESPTHLDQIRSRCSVFVSTSTQEPFGLSILEALAAGLCVVLPADGAFWSQQLSDNEQCVMYRPGDAQDLAAKLAELCADLPRIRRIGQQGQAVAEQYRAELRLRPLLADLNGDWGPSPAEQTSQVHP
jgi:glycosyltransferase involved in cell wall biosynthesis